MNILVDMNLPPAWVSALRQAGHNAIHWSQIGLPDAPDRKLMDWAKTHGHVVFTHDLDFGAILAASGGDAPSVIQLRTQDVTPQHAAHLVFALLAEYEPYLRQGALITLDENRSRVRILPLRT